MNTIDLIKKVREDLLREVAEAKVQQEKLENDLRGIAASVKANAAAIDAKVRFTMSLDAIIRDTDPNAFSASVVTATVKTRKKPGPRPKAKIVAETVEVKPTTDLNVAANPVGKKGGRKKVADVVAGLVVKPEQEATNTVNVRSEVKRGNRPPIKEAMARVMGVGSLTAEEILEGLKANNWLPNSQNPRQYIAYLLSSGKDRFERVVGAGRGVYRVRINTTNTNTNTTNKTANKTNGASNGTAHLTTDEILAKAGVLGDNVFGG